jgi:hypothetical protein
MPAERVAMRQAREIIHLKFSACVPTREHGLGRNRRRQRLCSSETGGGKRGSGHNQAHQRRSRALQKGNSPETHETRPP